WEESKRGRRRVRLCATTFTARHLLVVERASRKTGNTGRSGARRPGDLPPCVPDTPHLCPTSHAGLCLAYPTGTGVSPPRADAGLSSTPVLLLSALRGDEESVLEGLSAGADEYLGVPFSPARLVALASRLVERRRAEEQLLQAQKMEAVGQLAGGVAHDFNNLLTAINGYSDLTLRRLAAEDPLRRNVEEVRKAGERAAALTRQLLAFSRKQVLQPVALDLNALVSDMEKMLRRLIGEDVELRTALAPDLGSIKADPGQVEQVIMNLAVNARDAMPRGGKLTIETREVSIGEESSSRLAAVTPGPYVMLSTSDTGTGMDEETREHI